MAQARFIAEHMEAQYLNMPDRKKGIKVIRAEKRKEASRFEESDHGAPVLQCPASVI